jgi:branched-chain amino acid transport system permease protein
VLHIAHAGVFACGAYLGLMSFRVTGSVAAAALIAMLAGGAIGLLIERFVYRPMIARPRIVILIASIGLFICISDLLRIVAGPHQLAFNATAVQGWVTWGELKVSHVDLIVFGATGALFAALWWFLGHTREGFAVRAVAQDLDAAQSMGIDVNRSVQVVFFVGSMIAALGGVLIGILYNAVYTNMGDMIAYKGLALIVIGGFGSVPGAIAASYLLGFTETFVTTYTTIPLSREAIAMLLLVLLVLIRPQGLLGKA